MSRLETSEGRFYDRGMLNFEVIKLHSGIKKIYYSKTVGHVFTKPVQIERKTQIFLFTSKSLFLYLTRRKIFLPANWT